MKKTLLEKTIELALNCESSIEDICKDADIKPRWFYMLIAGRWDDPGVNKIERLYNTLKKTKFKPLGK
jgi:hypothetical protein